MTKDPLFTDAIIIKYPKFPTGCFNMKKKAELRNVTVAIKEKVVQAELHFLSADTLYRNL
jgi:hypothetical protein